MFGRIRAAIQVYLANPDPLAAAANSGAFLVWSSQPLYPVYVWLLVGHDAWPAVMTWLSTPFFFSVPLVARRSSVAGRAVFVMVGTGNTLVSLKAFGPHAAIGWFLLPCLIIAACFFRAREWPIAVASGAVVLLSTLVMGDLGAPLHIYNDAQNTSLSHLNLWSAAVLSVYLVYSAIRAR